MSVANDCDHRIIDAVSIALGGRVGSGDDCQRLLEQIKCGGGTKDKLEVACEVAVAFIRWAQDLKAERDTLAKLAKCEDEPQFYNPMHAIEARNLRDRILNE